MLAQTKPDLYKKRSLPSLVFAKKSVLPTIPMLTAKEPMLPTKTMVVLELAVLEFSMVAKAVLAIHAMAVHAMAVHAMVPM